MKQQTKEMLAQVIKLQAEIDIRTALYAELDMLTVQLQSEGFVSAEIDGLMVTLVDNFKESNVVFRPAGVKHYECKIKKIKAAK